MDREPGSQNVPLSAEDMLAKMRAGTKEVYEIRLRELVLPVRVLSIDEVNSIRREALRVAVANGGDETDKNVQVQKTTLKLATTVNRGTPSILSDKLLSMLSVDEINYLYNEFINVMERVNPTLETIPADQFRELVDGLKKNTLSPRELSIRQLRAICSAYVDVIQKAD